MLLYFHRSDMHSLVPVGFFMFLVPVGFFMFLSMNDVLPGCLFAVVGVNV